MTDTTRQDGVAFPSVPDEVMQYIHAYGDSRADDDGMSALRIGETVLALRRWAAALTAPASKPADDEQQELARMKEVLRTTPGINGTFDGVDKPAEGGVVEAEHHGLDTAERVCFYEQDFYVLSNFSSFTLEWAGRRFDTSEAAYHWEKFTHNPALMSAIQYAPSAHEAFKIAEANRWARRQDWDEVKVIIMRRILHAKAAQHEYVRRKLLATGDRELVENSWRDDFWGWGPNRDGKNMLGRLWMEVRAELRATGETQ